MYDIGVYDTDSPYQIGTYTRTVNNGNYKSFVFDGCVGVPLPIITQMEMKPVLLSDRSKLEAFFEKHGTDVYESGKYRKMARMISKNGAIPYLMPYPMESEAGMVSSQDVCGGTEKVSVSFKLVGSEDKDTHDYEKAIVLDALNGAVATARYENKRLSVTIAPRNGAKHVFPVINATVGVGGHWEEGYVIEYKVPGVGDADIECKCTVHLKQEIKSKSPFSFMLGGGAFDVNYDECNPESGSYTCTFVAANNIADVDVDRPFISMLMYPGYGSASSTVWYVLTISDKEDDIENYKITFAKYDATAKNNISMIKTIESISKENLTWGSLVSSNIIQSLSSSNSLNNIPVAPGTYVFTARGVLGGYKKWVDIWVDHLKNAPAYVATQVCVDWKYFTEEPAERNTALKEFEEYVLGIYKSENINTMLVVDEDLVKANYDTDIHSVHNEHMVVCKLRNSTESELLTCAVAGCLSASGCNTATAMMLDVSELSKPNDIMYYNSQKLKKYSADGVLCIHKVIGIPNPTIYHDITSYLPSEESSKGSFVHTRGYAVRTIGKLIYDIGVMYNSQYAGRIRNNTIDLLKSEVYAICKKYGESNHIVLMGIQDIVITIDHHAESAEIILPIQISPYVETILLTISI